MASRPWRPARSIDTVVDQYRRLFPPAVARSSYVGIIGDAAHSSRTSDHNPNDAGVVCAVDLGFGDPALGQRVVDHLVRVRDPRINYIIFRRRAWRSYSKRVPAWRPEPYTGSNPHLTHIHISIKQDARLYDDPRAWALLPTPQADGLVAVTPNKEEDVALTDEDVQRIAVAVKWELVGFRPEGHGDRNLWDTGKDVHAVTVFQTPGQLAGLTKATEQLASGEGIDPQAITDAVRQGITAALPEQVTYKREDAS